MILLLSHVGAVELAVVLFSKLLLGLILTPMLTLFLLDFAVYSSRLAINYALHLVHVKLQAAAESKDVSETPLQVVAYYNDVNSGQLKAVVTSYNRSLHDLKFRARGFWRGLLWVILENKGLYKAALPFRGRLKLPLVFLRYEIVNKDD